MASACGAYPSVYCQSDGAYPYGYHPYTHDGLNDVVYEGHKVIIFDCSAKKYLR